MRRVSSCALRLSRQVLYKCGPSSTRRSPTTCGDRIAGGEFAAGRLLPSEAELGGAYAASRMTVRKALELLRDEGLVDSRQGFGWFVAAAAAAPVARPARHDRGAARRLGPRSERRVLDFGFVARPGPGRRRARRRAGCSRCAGSTSSTACRGPASRCGARRRWPRELSLADVERTHLPRAARRRARPAPPRRSRPARSGDADAEVLGVPVGLAGAACASGSPASVGGEPGARRRARLPRPPHRVRGRAGQRRVVASPRAASAWCADSAEIGPAALRGRRAALAVAEGPGPAPAGVLGAGERRGLAGVGPAAGGVPVAGGLVGEGVDGGLDPVGEVAGVLVARRSAAARRR